MWWKWYYIVLPPVMSDDRTVGQSAAVSVPFLRSSRACQVSLLVTALCCLRLAMSRTDCAPGGWVDRGLRGSVAPQQPPVTNL